MKPLTLGWLALAFIGLAGPVEANVVQCCGSTNANAGKWATTDLQFRYSTGSFPTGSANAARLVSAGTTWTNLSESAVSITVSPATGPVSGPNLISELWVSASSVDALARTYIQATGFQGCPGGPPCCTSGSCTAPVITEADIVFFNSTGGVTNTWSSAFPNGQSNLNTLFVLETAVHEFGHAVGLNHSANGQARMSIGTANGGWFYESTPFGTCVPHAQDRVEVNYLYPASFTTYSDIYMSNVSSSPANSSGSRPLSYKPSTESPNFYPRPSPLLSGQPTNSARVGNTVLVQMCYGNLGSSGTLPLTIQGWLSTDNVKSSGDISVATYSRSGLSARGQVCFEGSFQVPNVTTFVNYWFIYGTGTTGNDLAVIDRPLFVIP